MSTVRRDSGGGTPAELGRRVGATAVLTGSLARYGGTLWINAELVQVAGSGHSVPTDRPEALAPIVMDWLARRG